MDDPNHFERGGWIEKNNWFMRWWTGRDYSIEYWDPASANHITPTEMPSNAVADFHTHTFVELDTDIAGHLSETPPGVVVSAPGPSCCGPGTDVFGARAVPDFVITNAAVYRLDPDNTIYNLGRNWLIQGL